MADSIRTLKEDNNDVTYPVTKASAVYLNSGTDAEAKFATCVTAQNLAVTSPSTPLVGTGMISDGAVTSSKIDWTTMNIIEAPGKYEVVGTTSGDFNYALKFADGRLICFQRITITDAASVAWGNCYRATVNPSSNYAVSFIAQPITVEHFTSKSVNDNTSWAVNVGGPSMIKPQQIYLVRPSSGNINGTLNIVAYGYWK